MVEGVDLFPPGPLGLSWLAFFFLKERIPTIQSNLPLYPPV